MENRGTWRIEEFGESGNLENRGIWRIEARLWKLQKARPDLKRELSVLSGPVFRKFVDGASRPRGG